MRERNDRLNNLEQMKENWKKENKRESLTVPGSQQHLRGLHCPIHPAGGAHTSCDRSSLEEVTERESVTVGEQETGSNRNVFLVTKQQKIRSKVLKRVSSVLIRNHNKYLQ